MTEREKIKAEAKRRVGGGTKGMYFELGAEYVLESLPRINKLAQTAYETAVRRGKRGDDTTHLDTLYGILDELKEFREASEIAPSEHLPKYTQSVEELADVVICGLTELYARVADVEGVIIDKIEFNNSRV